MTKKEIEEGNALQVNYNEQGLVPVITIDEKTKEVLMLAYMNAESLEKTLQSGEAHYYSRSRQEIWRKGSTSGFIQKVKSIKIDCDQDTLCMDVEMVGGACCHVGYKSCFYREIKQEEGGNTLSFTETDKQYNPAEVYKK